VFIAHNIQIAVFSLPAILTTTNKPSSFGCPNRSWLCSALQGENTVFWVHFMKQKEQKCLTQYKVKAI